MHSSRSAHCAAATALARWEFFALGHAARTAPHPAPYMLAASVRAACYRLRLSHLEALPLFQGPDRNFELRLGLTLWDSSAGCFFGPTMRGPAVAYDMRKSRG